MSNGVLLFYKAAVCCGIAGFAAYDCRYRRVPDRALLFFVPAAALSPLLHACPFWNPPMLALYFLYSLTGSAMGFLILLAAGLTSPTGQGIGGGDIKLAAVMGFIYGPNGMIRLLLIAAGLAALWSLIISRKLQGQPFSLPFVPFLAAGSLAVTAASLL